MNKENCPSYLIRNWEKITKFKWDGTRIALHDRI